MFQCFYVWRKCFAGKYKGKDVTVNVFEAVGKYSSGNASEELHDWNVLLASAGACGGQFTANTMACVSEAIGLALPYSSGAPAPYEETCTHLSL